MDPLDIVKHFSILDLDGEDKTDYYFIDLPDSEMQFCYSTSVLKSIIDEICAESKLQKILIDLLTVSYSLKNGIPNTEYFEDDGPLLLIFENCALKLKIHAKGLIEYGVYRDFCFEKYPHIHGFLPTGQTPPRLL